MQNFDSTTYGSEMTLIIRQEKGLSERQTEITGKESRMNKQVVLPTPRLVLRACADTDAQALHQCFADRETMKFW